MSETSSDAEVTEREEVAPGLVMEMIHTHEPDGRYLIYYNFQTTDREAAPATSEAGQEPASAGLPADR